MKITFVIHGKIKKSENFKKKANHVFENAHEIRFDMTTEETGAKEPVQTAIRNGSEYIIIAGGDGSINEAINGYMSVAEDIRRHVVLGVLPMGTGNDFAKSLQVTKDLKELRTLIESGSFFDIDVCKMQFTGFNNKTASRYYINIADIGIGGFVVEEMEKSSRILGGNLTYVKSILSSFLKYKKQRISLKTPGYIYDGEIMSLIMANGKYFGSGMCVAPDAQLNDGQIQLIIIGDVSVFDYLKYLPRIKSGEKITHEKVMYTTASMLSIESRDEECPIDMDGEFIGYTPIVVEVLPKQVKMIAK